MMRNKLPLGLGILFISLALSSCIPVLEQKKTNKFIPETFQGDIDTSNTATLSWRDYFTDTYLIALIDTALANNQELHIILQEIEIERNEIRARKGEYLPSVSIGTASGLEKVGRYTSQGANDANTDILPEREFPDPLPDYGIQASATWEVDIWRKLRSAKQAAVNRYLASVEGKNFMMTHLVSEIASTYYELVALDNHLDILKRNIEIQKDALAMIKLQKKAAKVTELAVKRFEAEVLKNRSNQFFIEQQIIETENKLNFLVGRYPQTILRSSLSNVEWQPAAIQAGIPVQLLDNRPDILQAEQKMAAAKLDVQVAKADFYPSLSLQAGIGYQAFNTAYLVKTPESMLYSVAGDLVAPVVNRNAIKAHYASASARQVQAAYEYEQTLLKAYTEVINQLSKLDNLEKSYGLQKEQVRALNTSITISTNLFTSARADYMEVMLTQRDALESKIELMETQKAQLMARIELYKVLGGGWH